MAITEQEARKILEAHHLTVFGYFRAVDKVYSRLDKEQRGYITYPDYSPVQNVPAYQALNDLGSRLHTFPFLPIFFITGSLSLVSLGTEIAILYKPLPPVCIAMFSLATALNYYAYRACRGHINLVREAASGNKVALAKRAQALVLEATTVKSIYSAYKLIKELRLVESALSPFNLNESQNRILEKSKTLVKKGFESTNMHGRTNALTKGEYAYNFMRASWIMLLMSIITGTLCFPNLTTSNATLACMATAVPSALCFAYSLGLTKTTNPFLHYHFAADNQPDAEQARIDLVIDDRPEPVLAQRPLSEPTAEYDSGARSTNTMQPN